VCNGTSITLYIFHRQNRNPIYVNTLQIDNIPIVLVNLDMQKTKTKKKKKTNVGLKIDPSVSTRLAAP
jgi:hypothetical protein